MGLVAPWQVGSSRTRDRTRVPCFGRQILNQCATREVQDTCFKIIPIRIVLENQPFRTGSLTREYLEEWEQAGEGSRSHCRTEVTGNVQCEKEMTQWRHESCLNSLKNFHLRKISLLGLCNFRGQNEDKDEKKGKNKQQLQRSNFYLIIKKSIKHCINGKGFLMI